MRYYVRWWWGKKENYSLHIYIYQGYWIYVSLTIPGVHDSLYRCICEVYMHYSYAVWAVMLSCDRSPNNMTTEINNWLLMLKYHTWPPGRVSFAIFHHTHILPCERSPVIVGMVRTCIDSHWWWCNCNWLCPVHTVAFCAMIAGGSKFGDWWRLTMAMRLQISIYDSLQHHNDTRW